MMITFDVLSRFQENDDNAKYAEVKYEMVALSRENDRHKLEA